MYGHLYIKRNGVTVIYKIMKDHDYIYDALLSMGLDHEEAADITDWSELAAIGEEYYTGDSTLEIDVGE